MGACVSVCVRACLCGTCRCAVPSFQPRLLPALLSLSLVSTMRTKRRLPQLLLACLTAERAATVTTSTTMGDATMLIQWTEGEREREEEMGVEVSQAKPGASWPR